jgi:hypothetical protein
MTIKELKQKRQDMYSFAFNELGVFFAFNNEQFNESVNKLKDKKLLLDNEKVAPIGAGGYIPSKNLNAFLSECKKIEKWYKFQVKELKDAKKDLILHELKNYECFYSSDISDALEVLIPLGIKKNEIEKVYQDNFQKYNEDF